LALHKLRVHPDSVARLSPLAKGGKGIARSRRYSIVRTKNTGDHAYRFAFGPAVDSVKKIDIQRGKAIFVGQAFLPDAPKTSGRKA